jgi:hypothetical protein
MGIVVCRVLLARQDILGNVFTYMIQHLAVDLPFPDSITLPVLSRRPIHENRPSYLRPTRSRIHSLEIVYRPQVLIQYPTGLLLV